MRHAGEWDRGIRPVEECIGDVLGVYTGEEAELIAVRAVGGGSGHVVGIAGHGEVANCQRHPLELIFVTGCAVELGM